MFVPGDQHVIVGTKEGTLELFSLSSAELLQRVEAHKGAIWSIDLHPNGRGFVSGGSDKELKFWSFDLARGRRDGDGDGPKTLSMVHTRTLRLGDEILCVKHSPDGKYVAAALLDCTVKVFHEDSLKFFISLYGHRLPVLCMDISSDGTLLASAGADKNVKIWGLDFGDCHKSFLAHDDSVMALKFVPDTHYVLTGGKDKLIRYWDADKFELVYSLPAHDGEVFAIAVSRFGQSFVSAGADRSIRLWQRTQEQVFLDEEREERLEELFDEGNQFPSPSPSPYPFPSPSPSPPHPQPLMPFVGVVAREPDAIGALPGSGMVDPKTLESAPATEKPSSETVKSGEKLMQALDLVELEQKRWCEYELAVANSKDSNVNQPSVNPELIGLPPKRFLLRSLTHLRSSELEVVSAHHLYHLCSHHHYHLNLHPLHLHPLYHHHHHHRNHNYP